MWPRPCGLKPTFLYHKKMKREVGREKGGKGEGRNRRERERSRWNVREKKEREKAKVVFKIDFKMKFRNSR